MWSQRYERFTPSCPNHKSLSLNSFNIGTIRFWSGHRLNIGTIPTKSGLLAGLLFTFVIRSGTVFLAFWVISTAIPTLDFIVLLAGFVFFRGLFTLTTLTSLLCLAFYYINMCAFRILEFVLHSLLLVQNSDFPV